jgi:Uma2 family endonuclease
MTPTLQAPTWSNGSLPLDSDFLYEIVNGEMREIPPMGARASTLASLLMFFIQTHALQRRLGITMSEVLFRLRPGGSSRRPDVAFVRYERWPTDLSPDDDPPEWEFAPNLAVEVVSPTNTAYEMDEKVVEYFQAGVELVWGIYPRRRRIYVFESATKARILQESDELDGGNVLPGFRLKIGDLFASLVARPSP